MDQSVNTDRCIFYYFKIEGFDFCLVNFDFNIYGGNSLFDFNSKFYFLNFSEKKNNYSLMSILQN